MFSAYRLCFRNHVLDHPHLVRSATVSFITAAASFAFLLSFQRIEAKPPETRWNRRNAPASIPHPLQQKRAHRRFLLTDHNGKYRNGKSRQRIEIFRNSFTLSSFFCFQSAECTWRIHKADHRSVKFLCLSIRRRDFQ